jgi:hypothetical protein
MRELLAGVVLLAAACVPAAWPATAPKPIKVRIAFTGSGTERFQDVERWIFLEENACYLRRTRDQQAQLTWAGAWIGAVGKTLKVTATGGQGVVSGSEVRDTCDEDELPPDAPENWIASLSCSDPVTASSVLAASWHGTPARPVLELAGPTYTLAVEAVCSVIPRSTDVFANIPLSRKTLESLKPGKALVIPVGSTLTRYGDYTPQANCKHEAKPYEGYRSVDECLSAFAWSGQVRSSTIR